MNYVLSNFNHFNRLWEDGWKQRYYKVKFDVSEDDVNFRLTVAKHYVIGLQWVLKYYYQVKTFTNFSPIKVSFIYLNY
jgi:5'-3' exonuclease